jgi:hypothetical protein
MNCNNIENILSSRVNLPLFTEVPVTSQESVRAGMYLHVSVINFASFYDFDI